MGRQLHRQRLPGRPGRHHLPLLLGQPHGRDHSRRRRRRGRGLGVDLLEWLRIDDPIGAVPVHGICGIWGTLSLGLFACGKYGATGPLAADNSAPLNGLFYGGGSQLLEAQFIGSAIITAATFGVAMALMYAGQRDRHCCASPKKANSRTRSARARHLGLSRIRISSIGRTGWDGAREGDAFLGNRSRFPAFGRPSTGTNRSGNTTFWQCSGRPRG